jgi:SAM-dependent methyltransferase
MRGTTAIWHDVECGSYDADLPLWEEVAEDHGDPILELGCGTGRVALHLARRGHHVIGLDRDQELIREMEDRAGDLPVEAICGDALELELDRQVPLVLAPMQFLHLMQSEEDRLRCLRQIREVLQPGGVLVATLLASLPSVPPDALPPIPDVREVDGWIYASQPVAPRGWIGNELLLKRERQAVSPNGKLEREEDYVKLLFVGGPELEAEAETLGFLPIGRGFIPATDAHVGSAVVVLKRGA